MYNSLKVFQSVNTSELNGLSVNKIISKFQETTDKRVQNMCFAKIFCDLFPLILKIHHKYKTLTFDERTEECIFRVYNAMLKYKVDNTTTKFSSYLHTVLTNAMKGRLVGNSRTSRNVWNNLVSCEEKQLQHLQDVKKSKDYTPLNDFMYDLDNSSILNKREIDFCKALLLGYEKNTHISNVIDTASVIRYVKCRNGYVSVPISDKRRHGYVCGLRKQIQKKVKENKYSVL